MDKELSASELLKAIPGLMTLPKLEVYSADNGYVLIKRDDDERPEVRVISDDVVDGEYSEQKMAAHLLYTVMDMMGIHFSKHGIRVGIILEDPEGKRIE